MQICAGGETALFSGGVFFFSFLIKILFVSIVPFHALCCLGYSLTSPSPCSSAFCYSRPGVSGSPVCMAKCSQSYLVLLQDMQEMEEV